MLPEMSTIRNRDNHSNNRNRLDSRPYPDRNYDPSHPNNQDHLGPGAFIPLLSESESLMIL